jgi:hypothetical protein
MPILNTERIIQSIETETDFQTLKLMITHLNTINFPKLEKCFSNFYYAKELDHIEYHKQKLIEEINNIQLNINDILKYIKE